MVEKIRCKIVWTLCILIYSVLHSYSQEDYELLPNECNKNANVGKMLSNGNCSQPAIEQFPKPLMGPEVRKKGGICLHIAICIFCFIGQAVICDYFVATLEKICSDMQVASDVAGATFMAAGSSAPEFATVVIGVLVNEDDIGVSGVIGSSVFNITVVIAACAIGLNCDDRTGSAHKLDYWPICRDTATYAISVIIMIIVIADEKIAWYESVIMLAAYCAYCVFLCKNQKLEAWVEGKLVHYIDRPYPDDSEPLHLQATAQDFGSRKSAQLFKKKSSEGKIILTELKNGEDPSLTEKKTKNFCWYLLYPIDILARATMPDLSVEKYKGWYMYNFVMSILWMAVYSYIMIWMITVIGYTFGIPDTVMGLTFIAAGVSVPDALSSYAVGMEGYHEMAISNALGSNVFDILVCLGLPWFLQTIILHPGSQISVRSKGLVYSTVSLLLSVLVLLGATHFHGWRLSKPYGLTLIFWYLIFITVAILYEMNVFGTMNPEECPSFY